MKRFLHTCILCVLALAISEISFAQKDTQTIGVHRFFLEAGGAGGYYSLNYSPKFYDADQFEIRGRIGGSIMKFIGPDQRFSPQLNIPIGTQFLFGKQFRIETELGMCYSTDKRFIESQISRHHALHGYMSIGGTYSTISGIYFGVYYTPIFENFNQYRTWASIRIGFSW